LLHDDDDDDDDGTDERRNVAGLNGTGEGTTYWTIWFCVVSIEDCLCYTYWKDFSHIVAERWLGRRNHGTVCLHRRRLAASDTGRVTKDNTTLQTESTCMTTNFLNKPRQT
jgi:hypothetical protein